MNSTLGQKLSSSMQVILVEEVRGNCNINHEHSIGTKTHLPTSWHACMHSFFYWKTSTQLGMYTLSGFCPFIPTPPVTRVRHVPYLNSQLKDRGHWLKAQNLLLTHWNAPCNWHAEICRLEGKGGWRLAGSAGVWSASLSQAAAAKLKSANQARILNCGLLPIYYL
jgi:hypothetical protein